MKARGLPLYMKPLKYGQLIVFAGTRDGRLFLQQQKNKPKFQFPGEDVQTCSQSKGFLRILRALLTLKFFTFPPALCLQNKSGYVI